MATNLQKPIAPCVNRTNLSSKLCTAISTSEPKLVPTSWLLVYIVSATKYCTSCLREKKKNHKKTITFLQTVLSDCCRKEKRQKIKLRNTEGFRVHLQVSYICKYICWWHSKEWEIICLAKRNVALRASLKRLDANRLKIQAFRKLRSKPGKELRTIYSELDNDYKKDISFNQHWTSTEASLSPLQQFFCSSLIIYCLTECNAMKTAQYINITIFITSPYPSIFKEDHITLDLI